jgi:hypothetical protein
VRAETGIVSEESQRQMEDRTDWGSHFSKVQPPPASNGAAPQPASRPATPKQEEKK